ncbi:PREDICTED: 2-hydroxyisoflavanone dehydratase [Theobroma cacao]|uniref:2-hydroxyisoflavanone dehydratase n=1 Tax=Theobroma cacao TaxID=3641 RepID=A0AB32W6C8_THECC|nr:PREDICTED: 2-hydroxyisoflavanone dehydratase [Theobroma cacao]
MDSTAKEVVKELPGLIKLYKDGSVERLFGSPYVPPSPEPDPETGVSSKDITISDNPLISARLYLPKLTQPHEKLPILAYFHAGGFCLESAFSFFDQRYLNALVSEARVVAVSVEYRLAPEHPLPAAYEDCWAALQWVASHSLDNEIKKDSWLLNHGDFDRIFIGGDSAGGNIVHNIALQAGAEGLKGRVKLLGAFLSHPYFWGSESSTDHDKSMPTLAWEFVYPSAPGGIDNALINPLGPGKPSLAGLGCSRLLVCVAEKDQLRDFGVLYYDAVKESGWQGEIELFEVKGEDHAFHILDFGKENSKIMIKRLASFLAVS